MKTKTENFEKRLARAEKMKRIAFKGNAQQVVTQMKQLLQDYTPLCEKIGWEPTIENAITLKMEGWRA